MSYQESIHDLAKELPINNGSFLITGATGLIGSCIIDTLLYANVKGANFKIYAMSRSRKKVMEKFGDKVIPVIQDVAQPLGILSKYDYIIHCASNADPKSYAIQPVETILTNILGNKNVLEYCKEYKKCRMLLTSTFEVYGEISNTSVYKENMSGIIDQTVLRNASIAEVASICAEIAGTNVVFDLPDKIEKKGFSQSKDCILDNSKLKSLGWNGKYTLKQGLVETIESLREDE